jgi:hypothetical protein
MLCVTFFSLELNLSVFVHLVISLDHISCRLYTEEYYLNEMQSEGIPEMQRSNLVSCIIQVPWFVCFLILLAISLYINAVNRYFFVHPTFHYWSYMWNENDIWIAYSIVPFFFCLDVQICYYTKIILGSAASNQESSKKKVMQWVNDENHKKLAVGFFCTEDNIY